MLTVAAVDAIVFPRTPVSTNIARNVEQPVTCNRKSLTIICVDGWTMKVTHTPKKYKIINKQSIAIIKLKYLLLKKLLKFKWTFLFIRCLIKTDSFNMFVVCLSECSSLIDSIAARRLNGF